MGRTPNWKKPRSKDEIRRTLRIIRDYYLNPLIRRLDRDFPYVVSFDCHESERPVEIFWDISIKDTAEWSDRFGCIGRTFIAIERGTPIAMMQAGGIIIPPNADVQIPPEITVFNRSISADGERKLVSVAVLTTDYFLTEHAIDSYGRGPAGEPQILRKDAVKSKSEWHCIDNVKSWQKVIERMICKNSLSAPALKKIREEHLNGIKIQ